MSVYTQVEKIMVPTFPDMIGHLAQQKGSKLRKYVVEKVVHGKNAHFDFAGARTASLVTARHADTPLNDQPFSRRQVVLSDYVDADMIDDEDKMRMLLDPTNAIVTAMGMALGRKIDELIIAAATGSATSTDETGATSAVTLPTAQVIDEDFGSANSDLTFAKIVEARRILVKNNVDLDTEEMVLVVDAAAEAALLSEAKFTGFEYGAQTVIESGRLQRVLGFTVVVCNKLTDAPTSEGFVNALAFVPSAIGLAVGKDITVKMGEDPTKSFQMRLMAKMSLGATRVEDEKVVRIECYRA